MIVNGFEPSTDKFGDRLMTTLLIDWWHLCWQIWWFIWSCNYFPKPYFAFARKRFSNIAQTWLICIISIFKAVEDIQDTLSKPRYILVCLPTAPPLRAADQMTKRQRTRGSRATRDQQIKGPGQATAARAGAQGSTKGEGRTKGRNPRFYSWNKIPALIRPHYSLPNTIFHFCSKILFRCYTNLVGFHYFSF